jgi:uncharacterized protein (DUF488 family)
MSNPFFTVGHSTHSVDEWVALLTIAEVDCVVDVRAMPRSRTNPQFNREVLPAALAPYGIDYHHCEALAGLRKRSQAVAPDVNAYWHNQSFHNYADYALTAEFRRAVTKLIALGQQHRCALMCAEAVWWRCHRRIIADYLLQAGQSVTHLMGPDRLQPAKLTQAARPDGHGGLVYPAP